MIVDTKLDDENKENYIVQNLENLNNNLEEDETTRNVGIVGSTVKEITNDCQKDSILKSRTVLETTKTSPSFSEEKIEVIENQLESYVKDVNYESNPKNALPTESENNNQIKSVDEEQAQTLSVSNVKNNSESNTEEADKNNVPELGNSVSNYELKETKQIEVEDSESRSNYISNTTEEIVSIIKRSPSDVSDGSKKIILKQENSDATDQLSEASVQDLKSSPKQKNQNNKSSTHRVKFTEELPTKSTLQYNAALTSSPSQIKSSRMGGTSNGETTPGHNRHSDEQSPGQVKIGSDPQECSEELPPQVMISSGEYPSKETSAFGTKIDR